MITMQHLKEYDSHSINITFKVNATTSFHKPLGRKIQRRSQKTMRFLFMLSKLFGEPKIGKIQMPHLINQDIIRLQIPIEYLPIMQVLHSHNQLSHHPHRLLLPHLPPPLNKLGQVPTLNILQREVQILVGLKGVVEGDYVGTGAAFGQDGQLG